MKVRVKDRRSQRGMTLTEVVISSVVLGIGVMGVAKIQTTSVKSMSGSRSQNVARQLAQQRIAWLATKSLDRIAGCSGPPSCRSGRKAPAPIKSAQGGFLCTRFVDGPTSGQGGSTESKFRVDVSVSQPQGSRQFDDAKLLTVAVCYFEPDGAIGEVRAERLVVDDEGDDE